MIRAVAGSTTYKQSLYFIRFPVTQKVVSVAMETDGLCLSSAVQDVLHEQRHAEHGGVGLQSAATTQTAQTQLQTHKHNSELSGGDCGGGDFILFNSPFSSCSSVFRVTRAVI